MWIKQVHYSLPFNSNLTPELSRREHNAEVTQAHDERHAD